MEYQQSSQHTSQWIEALKNICGDDYVITNSEEMEKYGRDETENLYFPPDVVVNPRTATEISQIVLLCNNFKIPITPRGAGTGVTGGALPHLGGIVLSLERFNSIINIDEQNLQVTTEPGVVTEVLQNAVKEKGLFYPPDPNSRGSCFIGGNIAENSGGPKAVKYGVVKDYVLNLEVVLPTGEIINTGANVLKNVTGYNITQLFIGSEGTLGIVTKIILRLIPLPKHDLLIMAAFNSLEKAAEAVTAIFTAGITPSAIELMEQNALRIVSRFVQSPVVQIKEDTEAHLIIEVDGNHEAMLMDDIEKVSTVCYSMGCDEILFAETALQKDELWKLRRRVAEAVKAEGYTIEEDTVVPRAKLPQLIKGVKDLGKEFNFDVVCYGHAGDGNMHIRIKKEGCAFSLHNPIMRPILSALFELVKSLGGTVTAEHGVGIVQKDFIGIVLDAPALKIMKGIKQLLDPNNIMNPGKIFQLDN